MLIRTKSSLDIPSSEITPEAVYHSRRSFMGLGVGIPAGVSLLSPAATVYGQVSAARSATDLNLAGKPRWLEQKLQGEPLVAATGSFLAKESLTPFEDVSTYNNFYEFGTDKTDPSTRAKNFSVDPWSVDVTGECGKRGKIALEDLIKPYALEERVYRLRCVEAWSMVIPWIGVPLGEILKKLEPNADAKFVEFVTLVDPKQFPEQGSRFATIDWPYREGLRLDEAMHPLSILALGLYGDVLPAQNGAPLRLVVPWKYGFKSIKSIVQINFRKDMPRTTWSDLQPSEYGFYANVNPAVDHPRWSQAAERRLPTAGLIPSRVPTLPFNGYADDVAGLYAGMDLRRFY